MASYNAEGVGRFVTTDLFHNTAPVGYGEYRKTNVSEMSDMSQTIWPHAKQVLEWSLKYWPILGAMAGGLWWLAAFAVRKRRERQDKRVLEALPEEPSLFPTNRVITIVTADAIATRLKRPQESVQNSLQRLRQQGLAHSSFGLWYKS